MSKQFANYMLILTLLLMLAIAVSVWAVPPDSAAGATVFQSKCASCHGKDGAGTAAGRSLNVVDLRSPAVQGQTAAQLEQIVKNGINNMPAFANNLSDQQIADVVAHVRTFKKSAASAR